ncbi:MAG: hypothetical protein J2P25_07325 [Nocardiopsaceae bacterium]|nr:hypothetical protein [Nocardiopsaceae bacterium]
MTLAIAAAATGVGAASATSGAQPWTSSLHHMAKAGVESANSVTGNLPFASGSAGQSQSQPDALHALGRPPAVRHAAPAPDHSSPAPDHTESKPGHARSKPAHAAPAPDHAAPAPDDAATHDQPAVRKPAVRKPAARKHTAPPKPVASLPVAPRHPAPAPQPAKPYTIYDSIHPSTLPAGQQVAVYSDGDYQASSADVSGRHNVLWIDVNGSNPSASVLDVEPGNASPSTAAQWVRERLTSQPHAVAIVYTMLDEWQQVKDAIGTLPGQMQDKVRYWIADPTGVPHIVPGSSATQWYWGPDYDKTMALPDFTH